MMKSDRHRKSSMSRVGSPGIALVVTLGLLAALLVMALGFAASMRIERAAAAGHSDLVATRQLILGALDSVIYKVNNELTDWSADKNMIPASLYHAPDPMVFSERDLPGTDSKDCWDLIYGKKSSMPGTLVYLPLQLQTDLNVVKGSGSTYSVNTNDWFDTTWLEMIDVNGSLIGVYSYLVFDETSRLDLNVAGQAYTNTAATPTDYYDPGDRDSPKNLYLASLPGLDGDPAVSSRALLQARTNNYTRYYTVPEIKYAHDGELTGDRVFVDDRHFTTYAKVSERYISSTGEAFKIDIRGDATSISNRQDQIEAALVDAGVPDADKTEVFLNLLDYVDVDDTPQRNDDDLVDRDLRFCGEAVPMINEIVVSNKLTFASPSEYTSEISVYVELNYPFVGSSISSDLELVVSGEFTGSGDGFNSSITETSVRVSKEWSPTDAFHTEKFSAPATTRTLVDAPNLSDLSGKVFVKLSFAGPAGVLYDSAGLNGGESISFPKPALDASIGTDAVVSKSVRDPRRNWLAEHWDEVASPTPTLGTPNDGMSVGTEGPPYVRNGSLDHVAELGFVCLPEPWQTLDLTGPQSKVMDVFTIHDGPYTRGMVNINCDDPHVLGTAFFEAVLEDYPGDPSATTNTVWALCTNVANSIITAPAKPAKGYSGLGELAASGTDLTKRGVNQNQNESWLRTCGDMLGVRGNTMTVILRARKVKDKDGNKRYDPDVDVDLSEQELVAQIWRDPVNLETQVTMLRWIPQD